jgi:hypothetical protein
VGTAVPEMKMMVRRMRGRGCERRATVREMRALRGCS